MNKYYKFILTVIGVLFIACVGYNQKLRIDESNYLKNLDHFGWVLDQENVQNDGNEYELNQEGTKYMTGIFPAGYRGIPFENQNMSVVAKKEPSVLVVKGEDRIERLILKENDPEILYSGKVAVNKEAKITHMDPKWSKQKKEFMHQYVNQNKKTYQELIERTIEKRNEIVIRR